MRLSYHMYRAAQYRSGNYGTEASIWPKLWGKQEFEGGAWLASYQELDMNILK